MTGLRGNYRCIECISVLEDEQLVSDGLFCPFCGGHIESGCFQKTNSAENKDEDYERKRKKKQDDVIKKCPSCNKALRIPFPPPTNTGKCTSCRREFRIILDDLNDFHLELKIFYHNDTVDETVKKFLLVLGLNTIATPDQVRNAYRKAMSEYHPDKVAHLGKDLQMLAEKKTKEINESYQYLKKIGFI